MIRSINSRIIFTVPINVSLIFRMLLVCSLKLKKGRKLSEKWPKQSILNIFFWADSWSVIRIIFSLTVHDTWFVSFSANDPRSELLSRWSAQLLPQLEKKRVTRYGGIVYYPLFTLNLKTITYIYLGAVCIRWYPPSFCLYTFPS